jgi:hypothetical protein
MSRFINIYMNVSNAKKSYIMKQRKYTVKSMMSIIDGEGHVTYA